MVFGKILRKRKLNRFYNEYKNDLRQAFQEALFKIGYMEKDPASIVSWTLLLPDYFIRLFLKGEKLSVEESKKYLDIFLSRKSLLEIIKRLLNDFSDDKELKDIVKKVVEKIENIEKSFKEHKLQIKYPIALVDTPHIIKEKFGKNAPYVHALAEFYNPLSTYKDSLLVFNKFNEDVLKVTKEILENGLNPLLDKAYEIIQKRIEYDEELKDKLDIDKLKKVIKWAKENPLKFLNIAYKQDILVEITPEGTKKSYIINPERLSLIVLAELGLIVTPDIIEENKEKALEIDNLFSTYHALLTGIFSAIDLLMRKGTEEEYLKEKGYIINYFEKQESVDSKTFDIVYKMLKDFVEKEKVK